MLIIISIVMPFKLFITPDWNMLSTNYRVTFSTFPYILHEGNYLWKEKGIIGLWNCFLLGTVMSVSGWVLSHGVMNIYYKYLKNEAEADAGTGADAGEADAGAGAGADEANEEIMYERKYLMELEQLEERVLTDTDLNELKNKIVRENTPDGEIIMYYNNNTNSYFYYTDIRNVSYKILDAVARCYAVTYNVKQVCVNYKEVWEKSKLEALQQQEKDNEEKPKEKEETKVKSVFADFKDYNRKTHSHASIKRRRYRITTDESNSFKYCGKIEDYKTPEEKEENHKNENNLSFSEFKKMSEK